MLADQIKSGLPVARTGAAEGHAMAVAHVTAAPCFMAWSEDVASLAYGIPVRNLIARADVFGNEFAVDISSKRMEFFLRTMRFVAIRAGKHIIGIGQVVIGRP